MYRVLNQVINRSYVALQDGEMFLAEKNLVTTGYKTRGKKLHPYKTISYIFNL